MKVKKRRTHKITSRVSPSILELTRRNPKERKKKETRKKEMDTAKKMESFF